MHFTFTQNQLALTAMPSGEIIDITSALAKLLNYNVAQHKTWAELLLTSSNYNAKVMAQVAQRLQEESAVIDLIIKFTHFPNPMLLSIMHINNSDNVPLLYLTARTTNLVLAPSLFSHEQKLPNTITPAEINHLKQCFAKLSQLEQAVVYLLTNGLKQREIADFLGLSRGYIASIIGYRLCPVLGIVSGSSTQLVKQVRYLNLFTHGVPELVAQKMSVVIL